MPLPAGQETEEIAAREQRLKKFAGKTPEKQDYTAVAAAQRDNTKGSEKKIHPLDLHFELSVERLRALGHLNRRQSGIEEFSTTDAIAFLQLFGDQLRERLDQTVLNFLKDKLSK